MKQEPRELAKQNLIRLEKKAERLDKAMDRALRATPKWWQEQMAKGEPQWVEKVFEHFLKMMFPSPQIELEHVRSIYEEADGPLPSPKETGRMFGHMAFHSDHMQHKLPGIFSMAKTKEATALLKSLEQANTGFNSLISSLVHQANWSLQEKADYHIGFAEAFGKTMSSPETYTGEPPNKMLYLFLLFYWPLVLKFKNITELHHFCVKAGIYTGDLDNFRRLCSTHHIKLTTRGRKHRK